MLPRRVGAYSTAWMDELCASGELVWVGAGALGRADGRVALYFREDVATVREPARRRCAGDRFRPDGRCSRARTRASNGRACFFTDLLADVELAAPELAEALWDLVWAGEVTNDAFAPLRAPRPTLNAAPRRPAAPAAGRRGASGLGRRSIGNAPPPGALRAARGRCPRRRAVGPSARALVADGAAVRVRWSRLRPPAGAGGAAARASTGSSRVSWCSRRGCREASRRCTPSCAAWRRWASRGVATSWRAWGAPSSRSPGAVERLRAQRRTTRSRWCSAARPDVSRPGCWTDPAQPYGAALPWRASPGSRRQTPARAPGASVVLVDAQPRALPGARRQDAGGSAEPGPIGARRASLLLRGRARRAGAGGACRARPGGSVAGSDRARAGGWRAGARLALGGGAGAGRLPRWAAPRRTRRALDPLKATDC